MSLTPLSTSSDTPGRFATGLASAPVAHARLAGEAVSAALQRADLGRADMVLLFLSADFADDPRPALINAARAAQTLAISGCTALGILTEDDWILDAPSAAALVIGSGDPDRQAPRLTLAAPNTLDLRWLDTDKVHFGGVAGDATGRGPFKVWHHGQIQPNGYCTLALPGTETDIVISRGMRRLGETLLVESATGFDVQRLNGRPPAEMLRRAMRSAGLHVDGTPALHTLAIATLDQAGVSRAHWPIISLNPDGGMTVATRLEAGERLVFMQHCPDQALRELDSSLPDRAAPAFGLMFSCGTRGATLHDGMDREWAMIRKRYPGMPLLGFYGNGQIANLGGVNQLLHHSVVLSLHT